jgi:RNA polymerase sigma factor (sigma-70 family)
VLTFLGTKSHESGPTDKNLLIRHRQGDAAAFGLLYDRYATNLLFYAHSIVGDASLAEDLLQECFLRLLEQDPAGILHDSIRNLLTTILRNLAYDEGRRRSTRMKSYPLLAPPTFMAEESGQFEALALALHRLPPEQREVVILKTYAKRTFGEIGELIGISEPTVKSRYRYALEKLADLLQADQEDS